MGGPMAGSAERINVRRVTVLLSIIYSDLLYLSKKYFISTTISDFINFLLKENRKTLLHIRDKLIS